MKRFVEGENRSQSTLFPESLDSYVTEDNPARVVDAFIDGRNLGELGFQGVEPKPTGRPSYHPSTLLKIYVYGYLNRIQSSRRLERETHRNVELMWLTGRLTPDFKTIADFRQDNGKAIRNVCKEFVLVCRHLGLLDSDIVAVDGSKFKAVNSNNKSFTQSTIKLRIKDVEKSIDRYLKELGRADQEAPATSAVKIDRITEKLDSLKERMTHLNAINAQLQQSPDKQVSLTDPDARAMKTSSGTKISYNVQTAVDPENHLIVAHEVTNRGSDRDELSHMAELAREVMDTEDLTVVADRGYYKGEEILACDEAGITTYVPKPKTSNNKAKGLFDKEDFTFVPEDNVYRCPAGETLIWRMRTEERGKLLDRYWSSACTTCSIKSQCTTGIHRRVARWEHEAVLDKLQLRVEADPGKMLLRKATVEHPYGTLKMWMGWTHFQMRRLKNVKTEMSMHVLAYNMKRVMNIMGVAALMKAMQS
jgi:transposase